MVFARIFYVSNVGVANFEKYQTIVALWRQPRQSGIELGVKNSSIALLGGNRDILWLCCATLWVACPAWKAPPTLLSPFFQHSKLSDLFGR
jgi:hypothetical protein